MSTRMAEMYEGNYLCGLDLPHPVEVEIEAVAQPGTEKDAGGKLIKEAILSFKGARKRLVVKTVHWCVIAAMHGKDESKWPGKKITLACRYLKEFMGEHNVPCVRVIPPAGTAIPRRIVRFMGAPKPFA